MAGLPAGGRRAADGAAAAGGDRRRSLGEKHTHKVAQLHAVLLVPVPGGAKLFVPGAGKETILAGVRPRDVAGKTRRRFAAARSSRRSGPASRRTGYDLLGSDGAELQSGLSRGPTVMKGAGHLIGQQHGHAPLLVRWPRHV